MIIWILVVGIIIGGIVWLITARLRREEAPQLPARRSPGLTVLEERYARGEITRDEYLQKRQDIVGD